MQRKAGKREIPDKGNRTKQMQAEGGYRHGYLQMD